MSDPNPLNITQRANETFSENVMLDSRRRERRAKSRSPETMMFYPLVGSLFAARGFRFIRSTRASVPISQITNISHWPRNHYVRLARLPGTWISHQCHLSASLSARGFLPDKSLQISSARRTVRSCRISGFSLRPTKSAFAKVWQA